MAMTLRETLPEQKRWAHSILDDVRDGFAHSHQDVRAALRILGEL